RCPGGRRCYPAFRDRVYCALVAQARPPLRPQKAPLCGVAANPHGRFARTLEQTCGTPALRCAPRLLELIVTDPVNTHLVRYCQAEQVTLTRCRAYHKNCAIGRLARSRLGTTLRRRARCSISASWSASLVAIHCLRIPP